jgi:hypothetical protein
MSKMRSPNYPAYSLRNCVEWVSRIWSKEGRTAVDPEIAAVAAGYKGLSGPSRTAIASMKKFGLLEEGGDGLRVSPLALSILHPVKEGEGKTALRDAAMKPALFAQLAESHLGASLQAITSYLITRMGFSQTGAMTCAEAFKDTVQFASLDDSGSHEPVDLVQENNEIAESETTSPETLKISHKQSRVLVWPLTRGVVAEVSFSGEELTDDDIDLLCDYLKLAKRGLVKRD